MKVIMLFDVIVVLIFTKLEKQSRVKKKNCLGEEMAMEM